MAIARNGPAAKISKQEAMIMHNQLFLTRKETGGSIPDVVNDKANPSRPNELINFPVNISLKILLATTSADTKPAVEHNAFVIKGLSTFSTYFKTIIIKITNIYNKILYKYLKLLYCCCCGFSPKLIEPAQSKFI